ncbi:MAG: DUF4241 domain-containing protein [Candidatus Dormibacteraeota bacterium]|nr:DUF4241 domain-containing protein [Candidatus Dormibacteraeota bacterium]
MTWPWDGVWAPLQRGVVDVLGRPCGLQVVDLGTLYLPSGRLCCFDPLAEFPDEMPFIAVRPGRYGVRATLADFSRGLDGSDTRAAYLSLLVQRAREELRRPLQPVYRSGRRARFLEDDAFWGVAVETGVAAMVDQEAFERLTGDAWFDDLPDQWTRAMDDLRQIRQGLANVPLPDAEAGESLVLCQTADNEGYYPIMGSYDRRGHLLAVHLDFGVVGTFA